MEAVRHDQEWPHRAGARPHHDAGRGVMEDPHWIIVVLFALMALGCLGDAGGEN
jgi:hypothetical protein